MAESPKTPQQWARFYEQRARKLEAQRARDERAAAKANKGKDVPHPLLTAPGAQHYQRQAEQQIEAAQRAEHARRSQAHPQIVRHGRIPTPPQPEPKRKRG